MRQEERGPWFVTLAVPADATEAARTAKCGGPLGHIGSAIRAVSMGHVSRGAGVRSHKGDSVTLGTPLMLPIVFFSPAVATVPVNVAT